MARPPISSAEMVALFPLGSQVVYSALGRKALRPRSTARIGIVEGYAKGGRALDVCCVRVRWPGLKTLEVIHRDYVEVFAGGCHS